MGCDNCGAPSRAYPSDRTDNAYCSAECLHAAECDGTCCSDSGD